jgi:N-acetylglucosaminyldiphosphoundecaprenol N-acetyl-beta-D-mannosaminyltransferase
MTYKRKTILNIPVDIAHPEEFILGIENDLYTENVKTIFAVNPEKIMSAQRDRELFLALKESDFLIPDGIGVVYSIRLIYGDRIPRVTGIGLMEHLLDLAMKNKYRVFLFGARPLIKKKALASILSRYPSLNIIGFQNGYIPEEEYELLVKNINASGVDILFVGLGSPKQEKWIHRYKKSLKVKLCMGIGGSLDVIAGAKPGAPPWIQNIGLEWLYRLIREPSRFKRQMVLPRFAFRVLKKKYLN